MQDAVLLTDEDEKRIDTLTEAAKSVLREYHSAGIQLSFKPLFSSIIPQQVEAEVKVDRPRDNFQIEDLIEPTLHLCLNKAGMKSFPTDNKDLEKMREEIAGPNNGHQKAIEKMDPTRTMLQVFLAIFKLMAKRNMFTIDGSHNPRKVSLIITGFRISAFSARLTDDVIHQCAEEVYKWGRDSIAANQTFMPATHPEWRQYLRPPMKPPSVIRRSLPIPKT